jgi:hypothetical protein
MVKLINKFFFVLLLLIAIATLIGCDGPGTGFPTQGLITIKGDCVLVDNNNPTTNYSGINIVFKGAENLSMTTQENGKFNVSLKLSNYDVVFSKNGFFTVTENVLASEQGITITLPIYPIDPSNNVVVLQSNNSPSPPIN